MAVVGPWHIDITPWTNWYSAVGVITCQNSTTKLGMGWAYTAGNQNDEIVWQVPLLAGTWTLTHISDTANNFGIGTYYLDATSLGTLDWYSGSATNVVKQIAGISVGTDGVYSLKIKAATKNASSSAYYLSFMIITLSRTA